MRLLFLLALTLFIFHITTSGQNARRISGDFSGLKFPEFVQKIEATTGFRFYYDEQALDSFPVNATVKEILLPDLLQQIFEHTIFRFSIDSLGHVFIAQHFSIQTDLPPDFFDHKKPFSDTAGNDKIASLEESDEMAHSKSLVENRLFEIGLKTNNPGRGSATLAGYVRDIKTGESVIGAAVYIDTPSIGAITDQYGYYSLTIPKGRHILRSSSVGMTDKAYQVMVYSDGKLNIELQEFVASLKAVVVISDRNSNVRGTQMGVERLAIKTIRQVPVVFGETDVLRVVLTLPGVISVGEASTGFNVRGGSADQNLILFSDATIYNPAHLFGFFSAFNPDVVKGVELYKSGIPEKYGGRLSSVLDVSTRDGNNKKIAGFGGLGVLTSKLTIEGPIIKDKTTFIIGGRTTYSNWLLRQLPNSGYRHSRASFYDLNLNINHTINAKNNLYLTGYLSSDEFRLNNDTAYAYGNRNVNLKWKHIFNNKFYSVVTGGFDHYQYEISSDKYLVSAYRLSFHINQTHFRAEFNLSPGNKHAVNFGINSIYYQLHPGDFEPTGPQSLVIPDMLRTEQALESALYAGDRFTITPKLTINAGLRYSLFNYLGPNTVYNYAPGVPKSTTTTLDSTLYNSGKVIKTYHGPEYRLAARYTLSDNASVKVSFNSMRQYIHMLSNSMAISPTDIWKLSDPNIQPQQGYQVSVGYYRNYKSNTIETSLEVYYKNLQHYLDYKSGATLLMNHHIETDVINTKGKAYGAEVLIKKTSGKVNGWVSYTYSRTLLKMDDTLAGEIINHGKYYPASFDKPHSINFIGNYRFSHRVSLSLNIIYNTGRPITLPLAVFNLGGGQRLYYSERNQYRIPNYFRADFSMNLEGNHKIKQLAHNSWSFGVYNVTGRQNAYSVYFVEQSGVIKGYKLSIFGTPIPFITYNFRF